ncbi:DNA cytosine methyltransferase [Gallicola sp. Sow4_E12]|uniref:DNA cytosine methyltransferase n=1 Tax=Gallicola sp. Sow4_E12 TaxID=3438785 RepID=UPI003F903D2E
MIINAIDLFCGVGGLTYGVQQSGINVIAGYDIDGKSKFAYEFNNNAKFILKDVKDIEEDEISNLYPKDTQVKVLMGCAPCQPFSSYSHKYKNNSSNIEKMNLLDYFGKQIILVKPDIVSMENVPQITKEPVFHKLLKVLEENEYYFNYKIVYAPEYGVPQKRRRLVLLASKLGKIELVKPKYNKSNYPTLRDTIYKLPTLKAGETDRYDPLHRSSRMSTLNMKRIKQSKPGGTWRDWDEELLLEAYKKKSGQSFGAVYGRLEWDQPSNTITTQFTGIGNGRFGHPDQDRALSLREGAMLQTFPRDYMFINPELGGNYSLSQVALQIGNAVPPKLGQSIGESIQVHLKEVYHEQN